MLLNTSGFASGINAMLNMLATLQRNGKQALNFQAPPINLSGAKAQIDGFDNANKKVQESIRKTASETGKLSTETEKLSATNERGSKTQITFQDGLANTYIRLEGLRAIYGLLKTPMAEFIEKYKQFSNAEKGLTATANYKGLDPNAVLNQLKSLDVVQKGVISMSASSKTVQDLLSVNYTLEESITLLRAAADAAAFNRQSHLSMDEAVRAFGEGIKNGNSIQTDGVGISKNLSKILKERGFAEQEVSNIQSNAAARLALYNGLLKESEGQMGNVNKLLKSDQGNWVTFQKTINDIQISFGKLLMSLTPLLSPVKTLLTSLEGAPDRVKAAAMAIMLLITAFIAMNGAIPNPLKLLSVLFAVIMAMPDGFRLLAGAIMILSAAMIALNGPIQVMSISLGGLPIILGMVVMGAIAIKSSLDSAAGSITNFSELADKTSKDVSELNSSLQEHESLLKSMQTVQSRLSSDTVLNKDEQLKFDAALQNLKETIPDVFNKVDLYTDSLSVNSAALEENIKKTNEKIEAEKNVQTDLIIKNAGELINATGKQTEKYEEAIFKQKEFNEGMQYVPDEIRQGLVENQLKKVNQTIVENVSSAKELKSGTEVLVKTLLTAKDPEKVWKELEGILKSSPSAANAFENAIRNASKGAVTSLAQVLGYIQSIKNEMAGMDTPMGPDAPTPNNIDKRIKEIQTQIGNSHNEAQNKIWQKQIDDMQKQSDKIAGVVTKKSGKKDKDPMDEAIEKIEKQIKLYEVSHGKEGITLKNALKELEANKHLAKSTEQKYNYSVKHYELENKINDLRERKIKTDAKESDSLTEKITKDLEGMKAKYEDDKKRNTSGKFDAFDEVGKLREAINLRKEALGESIKEENLLELITIAKEKIAKIDLSDYEQYKKAVELGKDVLSWENQILQTKQKSFDIDNDLSKRRIELIENEFDKRRAEAELEFQMELQRIAAIKNLSEDKFFAFRKTAEDTKKSKLKKISQDEDLDYLNKSKEVAEQIQSLFNISADTFFGKFLQAWNVTEKIVALLNSIDIGKGIFSLLGQIFGFVVGGPAGAATAGGLSGGGGGVAGFMPSGNSGITNSIANRLSGSSLLSSVANRAAVNSSADRNIKQQLQIEIMGKLRGDDMYLQWKRKNTQETKRTKK